MGRRGVALIAITAAWAAAAAPAQAARTCSEPGTAWERATPEEAGFDAAKLASAVDYGTTQASLAVRVYRHGCLVAEDRQGPLNRGARFESYSLGKSVTAMVFGRAMTLGLISPDDPVGSLFPEADAAHGKITVRDLLTMTSGARWNGLRDYNFNQQDRVRDALTLELVKPPGTHYEYAQSMVSLLAAGTGRAVGEDLLAFAQRELMRPIGIPDAAWTWLKDGKGEVQGFWGVGMTPDDYGRLGDLMRRGGMWKGRRLLSQRFMREALTPSKTNGCYGWLIWLNRGKPCIGPRVQERPVRNRRSMPSLPEDVFRFSGLFGQLVTVFPTQDVVVVRTGHDPGLVNLAGGAGWEVELYDRIMAAIRDTPYVKPADANAAAPPTPEDTENDKGFQTSVTEPQEFSKGVGYPELAPAGPARARALRLRLAHPAASRKGVVTVRATCPARWPKRDAQRCTGTASLTGAAKALRYDLAPGEVRILRFTLAKAKLRSLRRARSAAMEVTATNTDAAAGTPATVGVTVRAPR